MTGSGQVRGGLARRDGQQGVRGTRLSHQLGHGPVRVTNPSTDTRDDRLRRLKYPAAQFGQPTQGVGRPVLLFLKRGLYVEPDPRQVAQTLSWAGTPSDAALRRFAAQAPEAVDSYTQPRGHLANGLLTSRNECGQTGGAIARRT